MSASLKNPFITLCMNYTGSVTLAEKCWKEIEEHYTEASRYYHTLAHLEHMLKEFIPLKSIFTDADAVLFALFYHDLIYKAQRTDNEEKSAELARERLQQLGVPAEKIELCAAHILATKSHEAGTINDTDLFTDIDLCILGTDETTYDTYAKNVRKEYSVYPDFLYKPGRKKVLKHLLAMKGMFKTKEFAKRFEKQARENMEREINSL